MINTNTKLEAQVRSLYLRGVQISPSSKMAFWTSQSLKLRPANDGLRATIERQVIKKKIRVYKNLSIIGRFEDPENLGFNSWSLVCEGKSPLRKGIYFKCWRRFKHTSKNLRVLVPTWIVEFFKFVLQTLVSTKKIPLKVNLVCCINRY